MRDRKQTTFGRTIVLKEAESIEEFDTLAGRVGSALDCANDEVTYRGTLNVFRTKVVEELERVTGVKRVVVGKGPAKKDGTQPDILEKDTVYVKRIELTKVLSDADLNALFQRVADTVPFNPAESSASGTVAKRFYAIADGVTAAIDAGQATWDTFKANFAANNPDFVFDEESGVPTRDSLAAAFKFDEARLIKEAASKSAGYLKA